MVVKSSARLDGLTNGDSYSIAIIPVNINGPGEESNIVSIVPEDNLQIKFKNNI